MSSFEPISAAWMTARSFVAEDAGNDEFVPAGRASSADPEPPDFEAEQARTQSEDLSAEAREAIREAALAEARQPLTPALAALAEATAQLVTQRDTYLEAQRHLLVELAIEIAGHVVGRAVEADADSLCRRIGDALSLLPGEEAVTISLHPDDYDALTNGEAPGLPGSPSRGREVNLSPDATLVPGDALVESGATCVDARMQSLLGHVRDALLAGESPPAAAESET